MRHIILYIAALLLAVAVQAQEITSSQVLRAVERISGQFPQATLQDVYKSFYQDRFGPEHMISDTAAVLRYLEQELAEVSPADTLLYEPTGSEGRYVRVYLSAVTRGYISARQLAQAFACSATGTDGEGWSEEWELIEQTVAEAGIDFAATDRLCEQLRQAAVLNRAVHHSNAYREAYHPHYRIVARHIFESQILPLLP